MSLEELISLERIEYYDRSRIKETYSVYKLTLSKLFNEVLDEVERSILPILDMKILLYTLEYVPFTIEVKGLHILEGLNECMKLQLYAKSSQWSCKAIGNELKKLYRLIAYDYLIEGSLIVYHDYKIEWDLSVFILPPSKIINLSES